MVLSTDAACLARYRIDHPPPWRDLTTTAHLFKKGAHKSASAPKSTPIPDNNAQRNRDAEADPYDYSDLEAGITHAVEKLKDALQKTRSAGRISPETLEGLPVQLNVKRDPKSSGQNHKENVRLGDVATVVPKGARLMQIYVAEEAVRLLFCWGPPGVFLYLAPLRTDDGDSDA